MSTSDSPGDFNAQQQHQSRQRQSQRADARARDSATDGHNCPNCGHRNEPGAKFCEECGAALTSLQCPHCGAAFDPAADLCETCGTWLLDGQCRFCYAPLEPNAAFCAECGNPVAGIPCPSCGHQSFFDYCPQCHIPLSEAAAQLLDEMKNDPRSATFLKARHETRELTSRIEELERQIQDLQSAPPEEDESDPDAPPAPEEPSAEDIAFEQREAHLRRLRDEALRRAGKQPPPTQSPGAPAPALHRPASPSPNRPAPVKKRPSRRKLADAQVESKKKELAELFQRREDSYQTLRKELIAMGARHFTNNQVARNFFMAHKPTQPVGWVCNYMNGRVIHPDPFNCSKPFLGGHWALEWNGVTRPEDMSWQRIDEQKIRNGH